MPPKRVIKVVRKKTPVERTPRIPTKQKVIILRRVKDGEEYVHREEIPASIGLPEYYSEMEEANKEINEQTERFDGKTIIFLIGEPGSGKRTQSEKIVNEYNMGYIDAAELLHYDSEDQESEETYVNILKEEIISQNKNSYVISGFPMNIEQAEEFEKIVCDITFVIFLDVPTEFLFESLLKQDPEFAEKSEYDEIRLEIQSLHEELEQVFDHFNSLGKAAKIDGNREPDEVFRNIQNFIQEIV
ncbi:Adenylate kinase family protein [Histomonas meleagridis]|uniref:Adenylate kinase family protein n=1 Tax=Histomonas meleagridis TaxID=135588 RepID=UPI003559888E|nr:Adenylate kinase family protein [Histomonas meleagridis]KAH0799635.1 Adenylate kinase family protein [Histomonas meleagridis]